MSRARTYIFIDTSSLLTSCWQEHQANDAAEYDPAKEATFWGRELAKLGGQGSIIVPLRNWEELAKHARSRRNRELAQRAKYIIEKLEPMIAAKDVEIVGDPNDPFADAILLSVALKFRTQYTMWFITQDNALARDLDAIRQFESVQPRGGQQLKIRRVGRSGALTSFRHLARDNSAGVNGGSKKTRSASRKPIRAAAASGSKIGRSAPPPEPAPAKSWWRRIGR